MNIPRINSVGVGIERINVESLRTESIVPIRSVFNGIPSVQNLDPPVTIELGNPIVDMPGCVEAHETNNPLNEDLRTQDARGTITYCDGNVPSFNPPNYTGREELETPQQTIDTRFEEPEETKEETETGTPPSPPPPPTPPLPECPTQKQLSEEPIGFIFDSGRKEIIGYKLEGNQCVRVVKDIPILTQALNGIPPASVVVTTGGIAVVATTSALIAKPFADILLKVIKPVVKKVLKKVATIRGKQLKTLSVKERQAEQRDRNQAIAKLKSVKAKTKKK